MVGDPARRERSPSDTIASRRWLARRLRKLAILCVVDSKIESFPFRQKVCFGGADRDSRAVPALRTWKAHQSRLIEFGGLDPEKVLF